MTPFLFFWRKTKMKFALLTVLSIALIPAAHAQTCESEAYGCPDMASFMARLNHTQQNAPAHIEPRSLTQEGGVLYLGTSAGVIYTSHDNGATWQGLAKFRSDYVIDRIAVDGPRIYVAAWIMGNPSQGAFLRSENNGASWELTSNKVFRALALTYGCVHRACTGKMIYAGGPDGVYLSTTAGYDFEKISTEIKDVQSIAVDGES